MKPSQLWSTATKTVEDALPTASWRLIHDYDELHHLWMKDGCPWHAPHVVAARKACEADPLASIVMHLRSKGCDAEYLEQYGKRILTPAEARYALDSVPDAKWAPKGES